MIYGGMGDKCHYLPDSDILNVFIYKGIVLES